MIPMVLEWIGRAALYGLTAGVLLTVALVAADEARNAVRRRMEEKGGRR